MIRYSDVHASHKYVASFLEQKLAELVKHFEIGLEKNGAEITVSYNINNIKSIVNNSYELYSAIIKVIDESNAETYGKNYDEGGGNILESANPFLCHDSRVFDFDREDLSKINDASANVRWIGGPEDDVIVGGDGNDILEGNGGSDAILGWSGMDNVDGGAGDDFVLAGAGNDVIQGEEGDDRLYGGEGNDEVGGGSGNDLIFGEAGEDFLKGDKGLDRISGGAGDDHILGGAGDDYLFGGVGSDLLYGGSGNDKLFGGPGNDIVAGGPGDDLVKGGRGNDSLYGGLGADQFWGDLKGTAIVKDYSYEEGDKLVLDLPPGFSKNVSFEIYDLLGVDKYDDHYEVVFRSNLKTVWEVYPAQGDLDHLSVQIFGTDIVFDLG